MPITATAVSLTVADPEGSARFLQDALGFHAELAADGFVSLAHPDTAGNVVFLRAGLPTFKPADRATRTADGVLLVFEVDDIDAEYARIRDAGIEVLTDLETEEWGERYFQIEDPNGVIVQLVQWVAPPPDSAVVG